MPSPLFQTIAIIGPGLIGSSILRRAQQVGTLAQKLIAIDRSSDVLSRIEALGIADSTTTSLTEGVREADIVILCIPTGAVTAVAQQIAPHMKPGSILSDVASVRGSMAEDIAPYLPDTVSYVPAHPMAGTEYSGPDAGFATLFENRWCLLTPPENSSPDAIEAVEKLWRLCGARTRRIDPHYHDHVCAMVSHLPHLLAFTICDTADRLSTDLRSDVLDYAASGFHDFTRVAGSDPVMWRDIFLANRDILLQTLDRFQQETGKMADAIRNKDSDAVMERIERGRRIRLNLLEKKTP